MKTLMLKVFATLTFIVIFSQLGVAQDNFKYLTNTSVTLSHGLNIYGLELINSPRILDKFAVFIANGKTQELSLSNNISKYFAFEISSGFMTQEFEFESDIALESIQDTIFLFSRVNSNYIYFSGLPKLTFAHEFKNKIGLSSSIGLGLKVMQVTNETNTGAFLYGYDITMFKEPSIYEYFDSYCVEYLIKTELSVSYKNLIISGQFNKMAGKRNSGLVPEINKIRFSGFSLLMGIGFYI